LFSNTLGEKTPRKNGVPYKISSCLFIFYAFEAANILPKGMLSSLYEPPPEIG
jgi:hypothetical protein